MKRTYTTTLLVLSARGERKTTHELDVQADDELDAILKAIADLAANGHDAAAEEGDTVAVTAYLSPEQPEDNRSPAQQAFDEACAAAEDLPCETLNERLAQWRAILAEHTAAGNTRHAAAFAKGVTDVEQLIAIYGGQTNLEEVHQREHVRQFPPPKGGARKNN